MDGDPVQPHHNLPVALTPLIGRGPDLAAARQLLTSDSVRLLKLTGPPGTGKTRLGWAVAADLAPVFAGGARRTASLTSAVSS